MKPEIIYEDEYMLAAIKPYGVPAQADHSNREDMLSILKNDLYDRSGKDEEPYLAVINRLDRPVSGIMLFAKSEEAAAKLSDLLQDRKIEKSYQAVVRGEVPEDEGTLTDWLLFDKKENVSRVVPEGTKGAKKAELSYEVLDILDTDEGTFTYLLVHLMTGRHHQIRCQLAHAGYPIRGDVKYGPEAGKNAGKTDGSQGAGKTGGPQSAGKSGGPQGAGKSGGPQSAGKSGKPWAAGKPGGSKDAGKSGSPWAAGKGRRKNGGRKTPEIGLYSTRIVFTHPYTGEEVFLHREPEGSSFELLDAEDPDW